MLFSRQGRKDIVMSLKFDRRVLAFEAGMVHATLDPSGPGVARLHLIPPKPVRIGSPDSILVVNGMHIVPVGESWSHLLREFLTILPEFSKEGDELDDRQITLIEEKVSKRMREIYPKTSLDVFRKDLKELVNTVVAIARGELNIPINLKMQKYRRYMTAPLRMDLMVSPMSIGNTWRCPLRCQNCYATNQVAMQYRSDECLLGKDDWKRVLDKCWEAMIPQITFTGGEPTVNKDLVELVRYAERFVTRLNTSGITMTEELAFQLKDASLDSCQMTLYSADPIVHDRLVGRQGAWSRTVSGIYIAIRAGLDVSVNTPIVRSNANYLKTLELIKSLGVSYATCSSLIPTGAANIGEALTETELYLILKRATEYALKNRMIISFTSPGWLSSSALSEMGLNDPVCGACSSNMAITPSGQVVACQSSLDNPIGFGNILRDPWPTIWNNPRCKEMRNTVYSGCPLK